MIKSKHLTFYVDADKYLPILFFEEWMNHIAGQDFGKSGDALIDSSQRIKDLRSANYNYRFRYPDDYIAEGFMITKIEKDFYREVRQSNILEIFLMYLQALTWAQLHINLTEVF